MIDIGRLNKRITFCRLVEKDNEINQSIQDVEPYKKVWASVEPVSGKEYYEAQREKNKLTYKIYTRYFKDINQNMIIDFKGRKFEIESMINYRENCEMLQFVCTEIVGDTIE